MSRGQHRAPRFGPDRARKSRLTRLVAIPLAFVLSSGVAWAYWSTGSVDGGNGASAATTFDASPTPTASSAGNVVTVSWAASTLANGTAVAGYVVKRYASLTPFAVQSILSACTGTITALSCVESPVPPGSWQYTVTPTFATNWQGVESLKSNTVVVDSVAPTNSIALSNVTGGAYKIGNNIFYRGAVAGSFTLTNAVADANSGPASSATASLTGATTGWNHNTSTVSTPANGPYVSSAFSWSAGSNSNPGVVVTGADAAGNTTETTLATTVDNTSAVGSIEYTNGVTSGRSVSLTFTSGTDAGSGINTTAGRIKRSVAPLTNGFCGTYVTNNDFALNPTSPYMDSSVSSGNCYTYQYVVTDNVGNKEFNSSTSVAKVEYSSAVKATTGLVSQWRLGESSGTEIVDSVGNNNNGTYFNAPTLSTVGAISGDANTAAQFNGTNQYGTVARQIADDLSIEFWFKSTQSYGTGCTDWWNGAGLVDAEVNGGFNDFGVSLCEGKVLAGVGTPDVSIVSGSAYNNGAWHHVVFTRVKATGALALYVDGASAGTATGSTASLASPLSINFGRLQNATAYFTGTLDEIAVYNTVLSPTTVTNHYQLGTTPRAPVVNATGPPLAYVENASSLLDPAITATDADSTYLSSATVSLTTAYVNGQDTLAFTNQNGITGTWTAGTGALALTGSATVANYQTAFRSITYNNNSNTPDTTTRTVTFVANDGVLGSNTASRTITLTAVNDTPVSTVPGDQTTSTSAAKVFSSANGNLISVSDVDAASASVQVQLVSTNGATTLSGVAGLTFSVGDGAADSTMTFTGTVANVNTALAGLGFTPTSAGAASLQIVTSDQGNTGIGGPLTDDDTIVIGVDYGLFTNTANIGSGTAGPTSSSFASSTSTYTEVGNGLDISETSDQFQYLYRAWTGDGTIIARVTGLTNTHENAKAGIMFRETTGADSAHATIDVKPISGNGTEWLRRASTGATGVNTSSAGPAPIYWVKLVRSGNTFTGSTAPDSSGTPGPWTQHGTQSITMASTILVGLATLPRSATVTTTATYDSVSLTGSPQPPILTPSATSLAYTENSTGLLDSALKATDADSTNLTSATVTMTTNHVVAEDTLAFTTQNGITGTWTPGTGVLALTGSATVANYQTALRSITYNNSSDAPTTTTRTVTFVASDGALNSNTASRTITVTAVNDAPINSVPGAQSTSAQTPRVFSIGNGNLISVSDSDAASSSVQVQLVSTNGTSTLSSTTGLTFSVGDGTADATMTFTGTVANVNLRLADLSFAPTGAFSGTASLQVITSDLGSTGTGGPRTDNDTVAITVAAGAMKVQYKSYAAPDQMWVQPGLKIFNTGSATLDLTLVRVRYYFTRDGGSSTFGTACWSFCTTVQVVPMTAVSGADTYLEVAFTGTLVAGAATGEILPAVRKDPWSVFTETNDYSHGTGTVYADAPNIVGLVNGVVVWGTPPS